MEKQVILSQDEYNTIVELVALAVMSNDRYVHSANKTSKLDCHIVDSDECDLIQRELYNKLLSTDFDYNLDALRLDIREAMPKDYEHPEDSAWALEYR